MASLQKYSHIWYWYYTYDVGTAQCDKNTVTYDIGTAQCEAGTIKCEKKKKENHRMWQSTVTCDVGTAQCKADTIKCEEKK